MHVLVFVLFFVWLFRGFFVVFFFPVCAGKKWQRNILVIFRLERISTVLRVKHKKE